MRCLVKKLISAKAIILDYILSFGHHKSDAIWRMVLAH
jgi:hypothetical protein